MEIRPLPEPPETPPRDAAAEVRIIKKYPNRRLYDTEESQYITLADVRKLVVDGVEFKVLDQQTQADITNSILLQVIAEHEASGDRMLSREVLTNLIRSYGGQMQGLAGKYLEHLPNRVWALCGDSGAGCLLMLEHGYDQAALVRDLLRSNGYDEVFSARDIAGIERASAGVLRKCTADSKH